MGAFSSLALDRYGLPRISYYDAAPDFSLKYAEVALVAPDTVAIVGSELGYVHVPYTFTVAVSPVTVNAPLTYTWTPEPDSDQGAATVVYTWDAPGYHHGHGPSAPITRTVLRAHLPPGATGRYPGPTRHIFLLR